MKRSYVIGLTVAGGAAGAAILGRRRIAGVLGRGSEAPAEPEAVQWPFEQNELRTLMGHIVDDQREIVAGLEDAEARARAQRFLEYYEGRRAAAVGATA